MNKVLFELSGIRLNIDKLTNDQFCFISNIASYIDYESGQVDSPIFTYHMNSLIHMFEKGYETILKSGKYITDPSLELICNELYNGTTSLWDLKNNIFHVNEKTSFLNLRNWFFLTILDAYSLACLKYNKIVLHGALWRLPNGNGVILLGKSGCGKSTISYLCRKEFEVLSDDVFILNLNHNNFYGYPVNVGIGFLNSAIKNQNIEYSESDILFKTSDKVYLKPQRSYGSNDSIRIDKVIILDKNKENNETSLQKLITSDAVISILRLQTNIPSKYTYKKYVLLKTLCENSAVYKMQYRDICDIELLKRTIMR